MYSSECDESGSQPLSCTAFECDTGSCGSVMFPSSQPCSRDTDGMMCTLPGPDNGVCVGGGCECGANNQPCCGDSCDSGSLGCNYQTDVCSMPCGDYSQICCSGDACVSVTLQCETRRLTGPGGTQLDYGCAQCGAAGEYCCGGGGCRGGNICSGGICLVPAQSGPLSCPVGNECAPGAVCRGGTCIDFGGVGGGCADDTDCGLGGYCRNGACYACGGFDQFCCNLGSPCEAGLTCEDFFAGPEILSACQRPGP